MDYPETLYARSKEGNVAYQVVGDGPLDVVFIPSWVNNVDAMWEEPSLAHFLRRLATFSRLLCFDKRGAGASDTVSLAALPTLEQWSDDVRTVMQAAGSKRAALLGLGAGGQMAMLFAHLFYVGETEAMLAEVQQFLTGMRPVPEIDRVLATVLFTDIVASTERAAELGDRAWRDLIGAHNDITRRELARHRGREIRFTGDGFLVTFDGPARAIHSAKAISHAIRALGIEVRVGLHTGEIQFTDNDIDGIAVHIGARVLGKAGAGEIVVSSTVKDLVAGSGIQFIDRGVHTFKGVPGQWHLFAAA